MDPVKKLLRKFTLRSVGTVKSDKGMLPWSLFPERSNSSNIFNIPKTLGIVPVRMLPSLMENVTDE